MKVIDGDWAGKNATAASNITGGTIITINVGLLKTEKFNMPKDFDSIKLINKENGKTGSQKIVIILLAITMIGIPIAILLAWLWQGARFTVGMTTNDNVKFALKGEGGEWNHFKKHIGLGEKLDY